MKLKQQQLHLTEQLISMARKPLLLDYTVLSIVALEVQVSAISYGYSGEFVRELGESAQGHSRQTTDCNWC